MPQAEFLAWQSFYSLYPFDDMHRFHRPHALIAAASGRASVSDYLDWLQPDPRNAGLSAADLASMRALGFTRKGG